MFANAESTARNLLVARTVEVEVPGTGGELWQGMLAERLLMVNCPISYFARLAVSAVPLAGDVIVDSDSPLVHQAAARVLQLSGSQGTGLTVTIQRALPRGLGLASSTSEISATGYATARALGFEPSVAREMADQVVSELDSGNDGNYTPGLQLINPRQGERLVSFARVPALKILLLDTGGTLETAKMDRERERYYCQKYAQELERSLLLLIRGLIYNDLAMIGQATTENALLYQYITPKPGLEDVIAKLQGCPGAVGVCVGHSGTVIGLLARVGAPLDEIECELQGRFASVLGQFQLVSGGFYEFA